MAALNERPPVTIRANTLRISREDLATRLRDEELADTEPTRARAGGPHGAPGRHRPVGRLRGRLVRDPGRGVDADRAPARSAAGRAGRGRLRRARDQDDPHGPADGQSRAHHRHGSARGAARAPDPGGVPARRLHRRGARRGRGLGVGALEEPLRSGAGGRAVLEPGRAAPQSRREVEARGGRARPARREAAGHSHRRGRARQAGRAPRLRHLLARARGERRGRAGLPRRAPRLARGSARRLPGRARRGRLRSAACPTSTGPTASPRCG